MDASLREELLSVIQGLIDGRFGTEKEVDEKVAFLQEHVPSGDVVDHVYFSDEGDTAEIMFRKMMAAGPIILPDLSA